MCEFYIEKIASNTVKFDRFWGSTFMLFPPSYIQKTLGCAPFKEQELFKNYIFCIAVIVHSIKVEATLEKDFCFKQS
jgi:hypothetical protein